MVMHDSVERYDGRLWTGYRLIGTSDSDGYCSWAPAVYLRALAHRKRGSVLISQDAYFRCSSPVTIIPSGVLRLQGAREDFKLLARWIVQVPSNILILLEHAFILGPDYSATDYAVPERSWQR